MSRKTLVSFITLLAFLAGASFAQVTSSNIVGTVVDSSGAAVANAEIQVTASTGAVRTGSTNQEGLFRFNNLLPGLYTVTTTAPGFKKYSQKDINLASSDTRDLGRIQLEVGAVSEELTVTAQATPVQTSSAEKGYLVSESQLASIPLKGRDIAGMLQTMPGVVNAGGGDIASVTAFQGVTINGGGNKNITFDGAMVIDAGNGDGTMYEPNMDSVAEIRVLAANYQAEYGRNAGGTISVITKGGSQGFHGSGWWSHRHEQFNANSFFNNRNGVSRPFYRYNIPGYSIGGPVYIPGKFNTSKNKLFFFWSQEYTRLKANTVTTTSICRPPLKERATSPPVPTPTASCS
ncbi:MAG: carboxypeptidase regulatory-like domain-containing protein [Candidatus Solibacter sp.]|nr:carboxypeptidase regulatory-like domain-containing protein [Candidatus Solibacter sp.]